MKLTENWLKAIAIAICLSLGACSMAEWRGGETFVEDISHAHIEELLELQLPENATQVRALYRESRGQGIDISLLVRFELPTQDMPAFQEALQVLTDTPLVLGSSSGPDFMHSQYREWYRQEGRTYREFIFYSAKGKHYKVIFDVTEADNVTVYLFTHW
jgi:hypothetical protein